jgi:carboxypeptidase family protein/TonB-dependent receptor-like protein
LVILASLIAYAQTATATLSGTVRDEKGAVTPNAVVSIADPARGLRRTATTNSEGYFNVPLLPPSNYTLTVSCEGFAPAEIRDIVLNVGDQKSLLVQMKVGVVTGSVIVMPDALLVNTSPAVSTTIDKIFVSNLPLNGRSFQSMILLTPGVTVTAVGQDFGQFSVNGQRASSNAFIVDGVGANIGSTISTGANKNLSLAGSLPGLSVFGGANNLISVDALEEFKIQTSTYAAEFGRQPGGQISLVTRSGANEFRGSLFEYFRNDALDARNYFNKKPAPQTPLRHNQFGGTFSGPIYFPTFGAGGHSVYNGKDRTFFFFSYEGQRLRLPTSGIINVPSLRLRAAAAPALQPILNAFPVPDGPEIVTATPCPAPPDSEDTACDITTNKLFSGFAPWNYGISNPGNLDATGVRIDHSINKKLSIFGRYNDSPSELTSGAYQKVRQGARTRTLTVGGTSILSAILTNEIRFNYSSQRANSQVQGFDPPLEAPELTSGLGGFGSVIFLINGNLAEAATGVVGDTFQRQLNLVDNLSWTNGNHQLKFGLDYRRLTPTYGISSSQGVAFFSELSVRTSLADSGGSFNSLPAEPRFTNFSLYAQDTWKATRRLTLDLGLRWELNPPPTVEDGLTPPVVLGIVGSDVSKATLAPPGTPIYKTDYTAFAPRFGVAYQLFQTPGRETVLRGGFGVYYDLGSGGAAGAFPFGGSKDCPAPIAFPLSNACASRPAPSVQPTLLLHTGTLRINDPNLKLPYTLQWNFSVEQSLGKQQALTVSYVGSAGRRLLTSQLLNRPIAGVVANPNFGQMMYTYNLPTSEYNALQLQYRARLKSRLQALFNYTWSHAIDEDSSDVGTQALDRGNADFDVRHNFSGAISYEIPAPKKGKLLKFVASGWAIDAIVHAQSGLPVQVLVGSSSIIRADGVNVLARPDLVLGIPLYLEDPTVPGGRRFNVAAFAPPPTVCLPSPSGPCVATIARQGALGRNVLRELPNYQMDLALRKDISLNERWKITLKGEAFNVLNHPNFRIYSVDIDSPSNFGVPHSTLNAGLGGLNALHQIGGPIGGQRSIQLSTRLSF